MVKSKNKPTKRTAKKKQPQSKLDVWVKKFRKADLIVKILIIAAGLLLFWFGIVRPLDKLRFELAARDLNNLASQIQKEIGPADKVETKKTCGYASAKFARGQLGCHIRIDLYYDDEDLDSSNRKLYQASKITRSDLYAVPYVLENQNKRSFSEINSFSQKLSNTYLDTCSINYNYDTNVLNVELFCRNDALFQHYQLAEY